MANEGKIIVISVAHVCAVDKWGRSCIDDCFEGQVYPPNKHDFIGKIIFIVVSVFVYVAAARCLISSRAKFHESFIKKWMKLPTGPIDEPWKTTSW